MKLLFIWPFKVHGKWFGRYELPDGSRVWREICD